MSTDGESVWRAARVYAGDVDAALLLPHQLLVARDDAARLGLDVLAMVRVTASTAAETQVLLLECVVSQWRVAAHDSESVVQLSAWALEALGLRDGSTVVVKRAAQAVVEHDSAAASHTLELSVVRKHPAALSSSSSSSSSAQTHVVSALHCLPEAVRDGKIQLEQALARQLRSSGYLTAANGALAPGDLLAAQLLHETFVFRVERIGVESAPADAGLVSHSVHVHGWPTPALEECSAVAARKHSALQASHAVESTTLATRLAHAGFAGYDALVRDMLLNIALVVKATPITAAGANTPAAQIGSHGILLTGVHGVGKSLACCVLEREVTRSGIPAARIDATALLMEAESSRLASMYDFLVQHVQDALPAFASSRPELQQGPGGVLIIDDVDVLFESPSGAAAADIDAADALSPLGSALLRLLDALSAAATRICVVGTTTSADTRIPAAAKRAGRFGKTLEVIVPTEAMRSAILARHLSALPLTSSSLSPSPSEAAGGNDASLSVDAPVATDLVHTTASRLAVLTGGYVAKDLVRICRHALVQAHKAATAAAAATTTAVSITWSDLLVAQQMVKPSQLRELNVASPGTAGHTSSDALAFAGYAALRKQLVDFIAWKFSPTAAMNRLGVANASGILVHGPSGCGKSLLVRTLAAQARVNVVSIKSSEVMSKYFGDSEKAVRELFVRARAAAPCILFFDEFDAIAHKRSFGGDSDSGGGDSVYARILSTFLNEMDGVGAAASSSSSASSATSRSEILVIAATNRVDALDAALIRPGRIDKMIELGLPDVEDKQAILAHCTRKMPLALDVDLAGLACRSTGDRAFTGADLAAVCKDAAFRALRDDMDAAAVSMRHFDDAWCHRVGSRALDRSTMLS